MRERLVQVLEGVDDDERIDAVVRRFWSRTARPSPTTTPHANVVDLASVRRARARGEPPPS
jgi:hypothetical protein